MPPKRKAASKATESAEATVTAVSEASSAKKIKKSESAVDKKLVHIEFSKEWLELPKMI